MAINQDGVDEEAVTKAIAKALEEFYKSLLEKINGVDIKGIMKKKNPYLYRAKAMQSASDIVETVVLLTHEYERAKSFVNVSLDMDDYWGMKSKK